MIGLRLSLLMVLLSFAGSSHAQLIRGALIAGFNMSQVDGDEVYGYHKIGFNAGASAILPLNKKWSVSLETAYNQKGSYQSPQFVDSASGEYSLHLDYVEVPVMLHFTDKERITAGLGFSWGRLVSVKEYEHGRRIESTTLSGPYDRNDLSILADLRFRLYRRMHMNIRYAYSLDKIRTREFPKINTTRDQYHNVISFRVIYIFNEALEARSRRNQ